MVLSWLFIPPLKSLKSENLGKVSKIAKFLLEKCQNNMLFILDNVKRRIFAH